MKERIFAMAHLADAGVFYLLVLLCVISIIVIIERYLKLSHISKMSAHERGQLEQVLAQNQLTDIHLLELNPQSLEGKVMNRALLHLQKNGSKGLEENFSTFIQFEQPRLERSLTFLATVGSNAPYIGLFGTVLGIMKSFNDLAGAASAGQTTVMTGISSALIATAAGLLVAIPNILAFNYFQKQVKSILAGIESFKDAAMAYAKMKGL